MHKTARRQLSRVIGTSCLAVALALPVTAVTATAAPAAPPAAGPAEPEPPAPPDPNTPEPPDPKTPQGPKSPAEPDGPSAEPGAPSSEGPGTPSSDESTSSGPPPVQNLLPPAQQKALDDQIAALDAPADVKKQLKESLDLAAAAIADPKTSATDKATYERYVAGVEKTLTAINDPKTKPEDRETLLVAVNGANAALKLAQDPKTSAADKAFYLSLGDGLANLSAQVQDPKLTVAQKAALVRDIKLFSAGVMALANPKTAPTKEEDKKKIGETLQRNTQALTTLQDPNASDDDREAAQKVVDDLAAAPQNPQYLEFLAEVKKYDPSTECLDTIASRTEQAGWPDGSFWGLSDDTCADTLADAARDTSSKWNRVFECVDENAFSTCAAYIPED